MGLAIAIPILFALIAHGACYIDHCSPNAVGPFSQW